MRLTAAAPPQPQSRPWGKASQEVGVQEAQTAAVAAPLGESGFSVPGVAGTVLRQPWTRPAPEKKVCMYV